MVRKKLKHDTESKNDYRAVGYVFLAIAFGMLLSEPMRGLAVAFFAIGIAFIVIKHDDDSNRKSAKK